MKKFTYSLIGIFLLLISGSAFGALELHSVISDHIQRFQFPESAWLIVLGSLLISGATVLRRRRAARIRQISQGGAA